MSRHDHPTWPQGQEEIHRHLVAEHGHPEEVQIGGDGADSWHRDEHDEEDARLMLQVLGLDRPRLLTHVLLSECALGAGSASVVEPVGVDDQITHGDDVPVTRFYPAGSLVHTDLAERLIDAGFGDAVVELERPVVPVALDGDDLDEQRETFDVVAYSWPVVEPLDELDDDELDERRD